MADMEHRTGERQREDIPNASPAAGPVSITIAHAGVVNILCTMQQAPSSDDLTDAAVEAVRSVLGGKAKGGS